MNKDDQFYENIDYLKKEYKASPKFVFDVTAEAVRKVKNFDNPIIENKDKDRLFLIIEFIVMFLFSFICLLNPNNDGQTIGTIIGLGLFGMIFFAAGYCVCFSEKGGGLIFLFSHGMTGFCLMCGTVIGSVLSNPIMGDNPTNIYCYIGFLVLLTIASLITCIVMNLSDRLRSIDHAMLYPLTGFAIAYLGAQILPLIIDKLYLLF